MPLISRLWEWRTLAIAAWGILLLVLVARNIISPERLTGFSPYLRAAHRWLEGLDLYSYTPNKGFVYSPFAAVCYIPFAHIPPFVGSILWRLGSAFLLLGGLFCLLRFGPFSHIPAWRRGLVYLLLFPLALSNLDTGQANPLVIGLIMIAVAAASVERWTIAAVAIAGAFYWKIYPLCVGLLLLLVAPGRLSWRLLLAMAAMGLAPFLFQKPAYVQEQYHLWLATRAGDNRLQYPLEIAPFDLWFILVRIGRLPISETLYHVLQILGGAAIAFFCLYGQWKKWPRDRVLAGLFAFACLWMTLLGPASESFTYLLLAPAAALAVVECLSSADHLLSRSLAFLAYACLLLAVLRMGFLPHFRPAPVLALQPLGAMFFLAYAVRRYCLAW